MKSVMPILFGDKTLFNRVHKKEANFNRDNGPAKESDKFPHLGDMSNIAPSGTSFTYTGNETADLQLNTCDVL